MKKAILAIAIVSLFSGSAMAEAGRTSTGVNGVTIDLVGDFYNPNDTQMLQETTPVIKFDGLTVEGGKQVVKGYVEAFGTNVHKDDIAGKLAQLNDEYNEAELKGIIATMDLLKADFPGLLNYYQGIGEATGYTLEETYLAAWASDGLFAKMVQDVGKHILADLKESTDKTRGCTAIGWDNGVIGQNQDMPISLGGHGAILKSADLIVHAPEPFFNAIAMGRGLSTTANTVDAFHASALEDGVPMSGLAMAMANKFDDANVAKDTLQDIRTNSAVALGLSDLKGNVMHIENQLGKNIVLDGTLRGYTVHTNHPIGQEQALVDTYANGDAQAFDYAVKTTLWRNEHAEVAAKFSPTKDVAALKDLFLQKPLLKSPYEGNEFVTTNAIIHDLNEGCTYGTTWMPSMQEYTQVCFDK
ncbi:hypothetical protein CXF83_11050 [Shewanella sp. Choline-02u-19]|uniref:hypothetical protein n=1 Tax=unclassified Shewanella TaxID=196818 RepID=UPI000C347A39|nr:MULTISPECIES: hypothetical protein [unclassified Shewanella]PKG74205.1 hypothetical protein CXF86_13870 [Shewanella sp. GutCb]PKH55867.1 hypothetical protein CXF84_16370 [Shewanella sp. Bg11-22]PKI27230.1 hypothetical protein CXF83_11050 [Shewanella sp. Choline-02u-19]